MRHEVGVEVNLDGVRAAAWTTLWASAFVPHHSSSKGSNHVLSGIENELGIGSYCTVSVCQPIRQLPGRFCNRLQVRSDVVVPCAPCDGIGDEFRPSHNVSPLGSFFPCGNHFRFGKCAYELDESFSALHSHGLKV